MATSQLAQTTLRAVLGKHELDEMLAERERLNLDVQKILDAQTDSWGIKVTNVEIKHIDLNENMVRAIARQAEAERERRAKVIHAEGERQAAKALLDAAEMLAREPAAMQLRYLQTLTQVAGDKSSTLVFPVPVDILGQLMGQARSAGTGSSGGIASGALRSASSASLNAARRGSSGVARAVHRQPHRAACRCLSPPDEGSRQAAQTQWPPASASGAHAIGKPEFCAALQQHHPLVFRL